MLDTPPTKDDLLTAIAMERRFWDALVATVKEAGLMERPGVNNGPWTFKDMAAHVNGWRGLTVARLEVAHRGAGATRSPVACGAGRRPRHGRYQRLVPRA